MAFIITPVACALAFGDFVHGCVAIFDFSFQTIGKIIRNTFLRDFQIFYTKSNFCLIKIKMLVQNKTKQKYKFWSKIKILVKNRNYGQKYKFWSNIKILVKNQNFSQKSKF